MILFDIYKMHGSFIKTTVHKNKYIIYESILS